MRYINFITSIVLALLYAAGEVPPTESYNLWLTSFIIPVALCCNIVLLVVSVAMRKKSSFYYIVALAIGSQYVVSTVGTKGFLRRGENVPGSLQVLNYNVSMLGVPYAYHTAYDHTSTKTEDLRRWLLDQTADVQCYQEFINYSGSDHWDLLKSFTAKGFHYYFSCRPQANNEPEVGVLIVSKFPILARGDLVASENGFNRIAYADIATNADTFRIVNIHLESMGLKNYNPAKANSIPSKTENLKIILDKLKTGVFERSRQIQQLVEFVKTSPYPVVCAGDFNDMPYSYAYQYLREHLDNTFEEAGTGFGFTYNGNTLRTLRIDNQFYSTPIRPVSFETLNAVPYTDHFPLLARYTLHARVLEP